jgi:hypothetical protein
MNVPNNQFLDLIYLKRISYFISQKQMFQTGFLAQLR